uniref:Uncharacterized protein n=1 Tax=uncultured Thiotrichaceae bacterium TaxID=298394 RepID=A0A6S6UI95_9GAMM|nr:MAG: Unknown protein [uncultured Thiotrichaceae bacterium]
MTIYEKTSMGLEEIKSKVRGLSMIERRVLIFIDGKRTVDDLGALPRVKDLDGIITLLVSEGYIAPSGVQGSPVAPASAAEVPPSIQEQPGEPTPSFRDLPEKFQPEKFDMAKNFMTNTLNHFKGFYGATSLVREIDACEDHDALRALYGAWCEQMDSSRQGLKQGKKLRKDLLDVI